MSNEDKVRMVLSSLGRPSGHVGLYRDHLGKLAALWDESTGQVKPGARSVWLPIHEEVMAESKATDDATDGGNETE